MTHQLSKPTVVVSKNVGKDKRVVLREHHGGFSKTVLKKINGKWATVFHQEWLVFDARATVERY